MTLRIEEDMQKWEFNKANKGMNGNSNPAEKKVKWQNHFAEQSGNTECYKFEDVCTL